MKRIMLALALVGCGHESSDPEITSSAAADVPPVAEPATVETTENPQAEDQATPSHAMLVTDTAAIPACDAASEGVLIYVQSTSTFQFCSKLTWNVIDLKGKDGADAQPTPSNTWVDPITNKMWTLGGFGNYTAARATCDDAWRLPSVVELKAALEHGITASEHFNGDVAVTCGWTTEKYQDDSTTIVTVTMRSANNCGPARGIDGINGIYCLRR